MKLMRIALSEIAPPNHPVRAVFDEAKLGELAAHIKQNGLIIPLGVKKIVNGYEVVHGHRRLLACRIAGLVSIPCIIKTTEAATDEAWKVGENLWREELSPAEEAAYYAELMERLGNDVDIVCQHIGQTRYYVESRLNLLSGDVDVLQALVQKAITLGVAQQLNKVRRDSDRKYLLQFAVKDGATVNTVAAWVQTYNARPDSVTGPEPLPADTPAPAVPAPNPMKCWICQSSEEPYDLQLIYEHRSCRRVLERQAGAVQHEANKEAAQ